MRWKTTKLTNFLSSELLAFPSPSSFSVVPPLFSFSPSLLWTSPTRQRISFEPAVLCSVPEEWWLPALEGSASFWQCRSSKLTESVRQNRLAFGDSQLFSWHANTSLHTAVNVRYVSRVLAQHTWPCMDNVHTFIPHVHTYLDCNCWSSEVKESASENLCSSPPLNDDYLS